MPAYTSSSGNRILLASVVAAAVAVSSIEGSARPRHRIEYSAGCDGWCCGCMNYEKPRPRTEGGFVIDSVETPLGKKHGDVERPIARSEQPTTSRPGLLARTR